MATWPPELKTCKLARMCDGEIGRKKSSHRLGQVRASKTHLWRTLILLSPTFWFPKIVPPSEDRSPRSLLDGAEKVRKRLFMSNHGRHLSLLTRSTWVSVRSTRCNWIFTLYCWWETVPQVANRPTPRLPPHNKYYIHLLPSQYGNSCWRGLREVFDFLIFSLKSRKNIDPSHEYR